MGQEKNEDLKDVAMKLEKIRNSNPENYYYIKGWIHCLSQKDKTVKKEAASL